MQWVQLTRLDNRLSQTASLLASLGIRLYLIPIFWMAGSHKLNHFQDTVEWFGNSEWGLGLPFPWLMAFLATATELVGAILLAVGLLTRWISIPLIVTMLVAIISVHWDNDGRRLPILLHRLPINRSSTLQKNYNAPVIFYKNMVIMIG